MDDEIEDCPLCVEPFEPADKLFEPCECGFQICMFCWKKIRETGAGTCPACRTPYGDAPRFRGGLDAAGLMAKQAELAALEAARTKSHQESSVVIKRTHSSSNSTTSRSYSSTVASNTGTLSRTTSGPSTYTSSNRTSFTTSSSNPTNNSSLTIHNTYTLSTDHTTSGIPNTSSPTVGKVTDGSSPSVITKDTPINNINNVPPTILLSTGTVITKEQLRDIRVVQRNLIYVIGIPPNLGKESVLRLPSYFGQYGKAIKIVVNRSAQTGDNGRQPSASAYITYSKQSEALSAIIAMDGFWLNGQCLRACFGTTKYCNAWLRGIQCTTPDCLYLHELGLSSDSFSRSEMLSNSNTHGYNFAELVHPNYHFLNGNGVHGGVGGTSPSTTVASCQANIDAAKAKGFVLPPVLSQFMGYVDGTVPLPSGPVHPLGKRRTNTTAQNEDEEEDQNGGEGEAENAVTGPIIVRSNSAPAASTEGSVTTTSDSTGVYSQKRGGTTDGRITSVPSSRNTTNPRSTTRSNTYSSTTASATTVSTATTGTTPTTSSTTSTTTSEQQPVIKDNIIPHTVYYGVTGIPPTPITSVTSTSLSLDSTEDFPALPGSTISRNNSSNTKVIRSTTGSSGKTIAATISSTLKNAGVETATTPVTAPASWPALPSANKETNPNTTTITTKASSSTVDSRLPVKDKRYTTTTNPRSRERIYPPTTSKYSSLPVTNIPATSITTDNSTNETTSTEETTLPLVTESHSNHHTASKTSTEKHSVTDLELPSSIETTTLPDNSSVTDSLLSLSNTSSSLDSTILPGGNSVLLPTTVPSIMGDSLDLDALLRAPHTDSFNTNNSLLPNLATSLPTDLSHFNLGLTTNDVGGVMSKDNASSLLGTNNPSIHNGTMNNPLGSLNMDVSSLLLSPKDFNLNFNSSSNPNNNLINSLGNLALPSINSSLNSLLNESNPTVAMNPTVNTNPNNWNTSNNSVKSNGNMYNNIPNPGNNNNPINSIPNNTLLNDGNFNNFSLNNLFGNTVSPSNNLGAPSGLGLGTDLLLNSAGTSPSLVNGGLNNGTTNNNTNNTNASWLFAQNSLPSGLMDNNNSNLLNLGLGGNNTSTGNFNNTNNNSLLASLLPKQNQPSIGQSPLTPQQQAALLQAQQQQQQQSTNFAAPLGLPVDPALLSAVLNNPNTNNFNPALMNNKPQPTVNLPYGGPNNSVGGATSTPSQVPPGFPPELATLLMNSTPLQQQQLLQQLTGNTGGNNNNLSVFMSNSLASPGRPGTNNLGSNPSMQSSQPQNSQAQQQAFMQSLLLLQQQQQQQQPPQGQGGNANTLANNLSSTANNATNPNNLLSMQQLQRLQAQVQAAQVQAAQAQQRVASSLQNFQNIQLALQLQAVQAQAQAQRAVALQRQFTQVAGGQTPNSTGVLQSSVPSSTNTNTVMNNNGSLPNLNLPSSSSSS